MIKVLTSNVSKILTKYMDANIPVFLAGAPGVGKSQICLQTAKKYCGANFTNRKFVVWNSLSESEKLNCIKNPGEFYVFYDIRLSMMDPTSLIGIPKLHEEILSASPWIWAVYFTQPDAAGCIFFDEINLAPPSISAASYQIIHDRVISDRPLSSKVRLLSAGNRTEDKAFTFEMPAPLRDRFAEIEVVLDRYGWLNWAQENGLNSHVVQFINWKKDMLYTLDKNQNTNDKGATPRGCERVSKILTDLGLDEDDHLTYSLISGAVGEAWAIQFKAYIALYQSVDWKDLFDNPHRYIESAKSDVLYAIIGGIAERLKDEYTKVTTNEITQDKMKMPVKVMEIADALYDVNRHDMGAVLFIMCLRSSNKTVIAAANKQDSKLTSKVLGRYAKIVTSVG